MSLAHVREDGVSVVKMGSSLAGDPIIPETRNADEGSIARLVILRFN